MCHSEGARRRATTAAVVAAAAATTEASSSPSISPEDATDAADDGHTKGADGYALTRKVVSYHSVPNDAWVIHNGSVYDITLLSHPGGADILRSHLGTDVTEVMSAEASHAHSSYAFKLLNKFRIGCVVDAVGKPAVDGNIDTATGTPLVNWDEPILHQVGLLGDKYFKWIHSFPTTDHTVKMFTNDTIESLTKCPWYIPLLVWLPIIFIESLHFIQLSGGLRNISLPLSLAASAIGLICWLLFEYSLHRWVFHLHTTGYYANIFHFLIHGHHHITPMDLDRLVFPPVPAALLGSPFWIGAPRLLGIAIGYPWLVGFALGYLMYDMTHFWIHNGVPSNSFLKRQKRRHVHHHYFQPSVNFGISNPLFDYVFGTVNETTT